MSTQTLHDVFAVMAIIALLGALSMVLAKLIPAVACLRYLDALHRVQLQLAAIVAVTAMFGSLWFSEVEEWLPCKFCWLQRVFMFSSAVILTIAAVRRDRGIKWYAGPLAGIGILLSSWHLLLEHGVVQDSKQCAATVPCAVPNLISFGSRDEITLGPTSWFSVTLAVMAFSAFAAILALLFIPEPLSTDTPEADEDGES
ncbi:MAG: disulfide bond formation protein B [Ilumatobacteraceae bacterium]